jgi:hypothetical protein
LAVAQMYLATVNPQRWVFHARVRISVTME